MGVVPLVVPLLADQAPLLVRSYFDGGDPGPITATLAHVPELCDVAMPFLSMVLSASAISFRLKEIVIVRTSVVAGCRYCIDSHTPVAVDAGLSIDEVRALRNESGFTIDAAFDSPAERALLAWTDAVAGGKGAVEASLGEALAVHFREFEIVELTTLAAATVMLNRFASSLGLPVSAATQSRLAAQGFASAP